MLTNFTSKDNKFSTKSHVRALNYSKNSHRGGGHPLPLDPSPRTVIKITAWPPRQQIPGYASALRLYSLSGIIWKFRAEKLLPPQMEMLPYAYAY